MAVNTGENVFGSGPEWAQSAEKSSTGQRLHSVLDPGGFTMGTPSIDGAWFDTGLDAGGWIAQGDAMGAEAQNREINPEVYAMLLEAAQGKTPSAAQLQMMAGLQRNQASMQSMAASNPNISPAMAQRMAMNAGSQMGLETNQQMAALRAQEMAQAQGQLAGYTLQQQALNDAMTQMYMQRGDSRAEAELKAPER